MNENGCVHLNSFKSSKGLQLLKFLFTYFISTSSSKAKIFKALSNFCHSCNIINPRLHSCLHCIYIGCYHGGHIQEHAKLKNHYLAMDLVYGMTLCFQCGDYVYDKEILLMARDYCIKSVGPFSIDKLDRRSHNLIRNPKRKKIENSSFGLRGIFNLGNTCYMNSLIQIFTHTPVLRDFFLSDKNHICQFPNEPEKCAFCVLSDIFQEFYSGNPYPIYIPKYLNLIWTYEDNFVSKEQQDVHEFYIAFLNLLHKHSSLNPDENCKCIFDHLFSGHLQMKMMCQSCGTISKRHETIFDIGLDLIHMPNDNYTVSMNASTSLPSTNADVSVSDGVNNKLKDNEEKKSEITLINCLEEYIRPEHLSKTIECIECKGYQDSTRQYSLKKLPIVICFQLKRFKIKKKQKEKISAPCSFPEFLDMTPYMSQKQNINMNKDHSTNGINHLSLAENRYSLFGVIQHSGNDPESGHYTCYIRQHGNWFLCDDDQIFKHNLDTVLNSQGYLLFYHKQLLEYD